MNDAAVRHQRTGGDVSRKQRPLGVRHFKVNCEVLSLRFSFTCGSVVDGTKPARLSPADSDGPSL